MTIQECYQKFDGDYEGVLSRLLDAARVEKFAVRFLDIADYKQLQEAVETENWKNAFLSAHTIKGIALNLGFSSLASASSDMTELLRDKEDVDSNQAHDLFAKIVPEYERVVTALKEFSGRQ